MSRPDSRYPDETYDERTERITKMLDGGYSSLLYSDARFLLEEVARVRVLLRKMRETLNEDESKYTPLLLSSLVFEAMNGLPCLCDSVKDGMKFVERDQCPRHGIPGQRFGEDGYVES